MNTMNMPGFNAELSLTRKGNYYQQFAARSMTSPGMIQPALVNIPRPYCWCAEWDVIEKGGGGVFDWFGTLVEACVRWECVVIPVFYDV